MYTGIRGCCGAAGLGDWVDDVNKLIQEGSQAVSNIVTSAKLPAYPQIQLPTGYQYSATTNQVVPIASSELFPGLSNELLLVGGLAAIFLLRKKRT